MSQIIFFCDLHFYSSYALDEHRAEVDSGREGIILGGDILDVANCLNSQVKVVLDHGKRLVEKYGGWYLQGNHERGALSHHTYCKVNRTLFAHGDWEFWGHERTAKAWGGGRGVNPLLWHAKRAMELKDWGGTEWTKDVVARVLQVLEKYDCDNYVCGHKHPKEPVQHFVGAKSMVVLPRGRHVIDV